MHMVTFFFLKDVLYDPVLVLRSLRNGPRQRGIDPCDTLPGTPMGRRVPGGGTIQMPISSTGVGADQCLGTGDTVLAEFAQGRRAGVGADQLLVVTRMRGTGRTFGAVFGSASGVGAGH